MADLILLQPTKDSSPPVICGGIIARVDRFKSSWQIRLSLLLGTGWAGSVEEGHFDGDWGKVGGLGGIWAGDLIKF